ARVRRRGLERDVLGVDGMVLAVVDGDLDVLDREASQRPGRHTRPDALLAARLELRRDRPTHYAPLELEAGAAGQRFHAQGHLGELPGATGLLLVAVPGIARAGDRLAVGDGRGAGL